MAETTQRPSKVPFTIGSYAGGVVGVVGCGWLAVIIATNTHAATAGTAAPYGPGWAALATVLAILGGVAVAALQLAWLVVDTRSEVRAIHALLASTSLSLPQQQRVEELAERQEEAEKALAHVAARVDLAYTTGFTDGIGQATG